MDYLVERMRVAGCSDLRIVTRPEKRDVVANASQHGARVIEARPSSVAESLVIGAQDLGAEDIVLFGLPDTIWEPKDGYAKLVEALQPTDDLVLGIFSTADLERSDVVTVGETGLVERVDVKPERPASSWVWGCGVARRPTLSGLAGETEPGHYFDRIARLGRVRSVWLSDTFIDIGTPESLQLALAHEGWRQ